MCRGMGVAARSRGERGRGATLRVTLRSSGHVAGVGIERSATGAFVGRWTAGHPQKVACKVRTRTFVRLCPFRAEAPAVSHRVAIL